jgi:hypothetical protein
MFKIEKYIGGNENKYCCITLVYCTHTCTLYSGTYIHDIPVCNTDDVCVHVVYVYLYSSV